MTSSLISVKYQHNSATLGKNKINKNNLCIDFDLILQ